MCESGASDSNNKLAGLMSQWIILNLWMQFKANTMSEINFAAIRSLIFGLSAYLPKRIPPLRYSVII